MEKFDLLINGKKKAAEGGKCFESMNPSTGEGFAQIADASVDDMRSAICAAKTAFDSGVWSGLSVAERGVYLKRIAALIRENAKALADLECRDTGKTIKQTTFIDIPTVADTFEYFGSISKELEDSLNPVAAPVKSITAREPMGVVGCIIPWNYPLIMFGWKAAPALIAGNTVVFKPSSKASVSIVKLAQIIQQVGLPDGVLNIVPTSQHAAGEELIQSEDVDKISFTGGTAFGQEVMKMAASNAKKLTLELGGKSPNIVFADCNMESAIGGTMSAIFMNQGQMCTAGSRLLLEDKIYDEFLPKLIKKTKNLSLGNAMDHSTDFGPLISRAQRDSVLKMIQTAQAEGATVACGGKAPEGDHDKSGCYLEPTILTDVKNSMNIAQEEVFGPVLCVIKFSGLDEAIAIANDSKYGLASCVWTQDTKKADTVSRKLRTGTVWVNTYGGFYDQAPIGGCKQSGFGRELGLEGLLEYTQTKHICIDQTPGGSPLVANWF